MTVGVSRIRLRRGALHWLLMNINFLPVSFVGLLVVGGAVSGRLDTLLVGIALSPLCLSPMLLGATLEGELLTWGWVGSRRQISVGEVRVVSIGTIAEYGPFGVNTTGLWIELVSGEIIALPESMANARRRLRGWTTEMKLRNPSIEVKEPSVPLQLP